MPRGRLYEYSLPRQKASWQPTRPRRRGRGQLPWEPSHRRPPPRIHRARQRLCHRHRVENEDHASEVGDTCRENALFISAEEDVLMLFPAMNIRRTTAMRGLDILERP